MLVFPNTLIYLCVYFPLCPLYCNTVLANLNARQLIEKLGRPDSAVDWRNTQWSGLIILGQSTTLEEHDLSQTQVGTS